MGWQKKNTTREFTQTSPQVKPMESAVVLNICKSSTPTKSRRKRLIFFSLTCWNELMEDDEIVTDGVHSWFTVWVYVLPELQTANTHQDITRWDKTMQTMDSWAINLLSLILSLCFFYAPNVQQSCPPVWQLTWFRCIHDIYIACCFLNIIIFFNLKTLSLTFSI